MKAPNLNRRSLFAGLFGLFAVASLPKIVLAKPVLDPLVGEKRRIVTLVQEKLEQILKNHIFEVNDYSTRHSVCGWMEGGLLGLRRDRTIRDFKFVCDETNNGPKVIRLGQLRADVYLKFNNSVSFVKISGMTTKTAVNLTTLNENG